MKQREQMKMNKYIHIHTHIHTISQELGEEWKKNNNNNTNNTRRIREIGSALEQSVKNFFILCSVCFIKIYKLSAVRRWFGISEGWLAVAASICLYCLHLLIHLMCTVLLIKIDNDDVLFSVFISVLCYFIWCHEMNCERAVWVVSVCVYRYLHCFQHMWWEQIEASKLIWT